MPQIISRSRHDILRGSDGRLDHLLPILGVSSYNGSKNDLYPPSIHMTKLSQQLPQLHYIVSLSFVNGICQKRLPRIARDVTNMLARVSFVLLARWTDASRGHEV